MFLFSTDIDGTIHDEAEAAGRFAEFWNPLSRNESPPLLVYNSGRVVDDILDLIERTRLPEPDYLIGGVGTQIVEFRTRKWLSAWGSELQKGWSFDDAASVAYDIGTDIELQPDECQNPFKCSWFWRDKTEADLARLRAELDRAGLEAQVVYSSSRDLDILPARANKGNALAWLAQQLDRPSEPVIVAGDSGNDSSMYYVEGATGIVVANAEQALRDAVAGCEVHFASKPCAYGVIEVLESLLSRRHAST